MAGPRADTKVRPYERPVIKKSWQASSRGPGARGLGSMTLPGPPQREGAGREVEEASISAIQMALKTENGAKTLHPIVNDNDLIVRLN